MYKTDFLKQMFSLEHVTLWNGGVWFTVLKYFKFFLTFYQNK